MTTDDHTSTDDLDSSDESTAMPPPTRRWRSLAIQSTFFLIVFALLLDAAPRSWGWLTAPKQILDECLNRIGLWQGEWAMFTPHPVLNNGWVQADLYDADQRIHNWMSPNWEEATVWEKFYRFRHVNYYNRLKGNAVGGEALARYLVNQHRGESPIRNVVLFQYRRNLLRDVDAPLPKLDESVWGGGQEFLVQKKFEP